MSLLLNTAGLTMQYGATPLLEDIALTIEDGDRIGIVGPNGAGKSTLLELLAGRREPDAGTIAVRKGVRVAYVAQVSAYTGPETIRQLVERACPPGEDKSRLVVETLGKAGFEDFDAVAASLSGGWRKRVAIAEALVTAPDLLLLDEPTNHLDLEGIEWLERLLASASFASAVVSHDRYFLENVVNSMVELSRAYPDGIFRTRGNYSVFLERKSDFMAAQARHQEALENRVRRELEWLRRGPKARATKAKARIEKANELIGELKDSTARSQSQQVNIDFTATHRKTKRLIETRNLTCRLGDRTILSNVDLVLTAGMRVGLAGPNGSGKTTLLRLLRGELDAQSGDIVRADGLRLVYFDQNRELDESLTLRRALAPHGDSVIYRDNTMHVASWAARFLFTSEQLEQPVARLSGGERARVLIAKLMLEPADVLLLDEPTNDLDIPTLEILEESLLDFLGALVLVTHDRFLLDRVSTTIWGLDGAGSLGRFADYRQWEEWRDERRKQANQAPSKEKSYEKTPLAAPQPKKKLSYLEGRDFATIEDRIGTAEVDLKTKQSLLDDPEVTRDPERLQTTLSEIEAAQSHVDHLYSRWAELEAKIS